MSDHELYPLLLQPSLHTKVWGGRKLETVLGKDLPTDEPYGESWELHDTATIENGEFAGKTLGDVLAEFGTLLCGEGNDPAEGFPLLAKFLDANDWLSVQVHPNDEQAQRLENFPRGKTEAWIVLSAEPNAQLVIGVESGTSQEAMAEAIRDNRLEDLLVKADVQKGDVLYLQANTVHALGDGILIYEIQQSSDLTYRLYDWGRMGLDGKPRDLHIDKGVAVSNLTTLPEIKQIEETESQMQVVVAGEYFQTLLHRVDDFSVTIENNGRFHALTCIEGGLAVESEGVSVEFGLGRTVLIPACMEDYTLAGKGEALVSFQRGKLA